MSHVCVDQENSEKKERLLLLFPGLLVVLSISPRMSGYVYEVRYQANRNRLIVGLSISPHRVNMLKFIQTFYKFLKNKSVHL